MKHIGEFIKRGMMYAGFGPLVLAVVYCLLARSGEIITLSPSEVVSGIVSVTILAFIAAGITTIYNTERLPIISAVLINGAVLYLDYLIVYLINNWIPRNGIGIFTAIFFASYLVIWLIIYFCTRAKTQRLNKKLNK